MSYILSPSEQLYYIGTFVPILVLPKVEGYISTKNLLAVYNHKKLTVYNTSNIEELNKLGKELPQVNTMDFNKKVEVLTFVDQDVIVSDKYGDIFLVTKNNKKFLNQNFCIPTLIHYVEIQNHRAFIIGDQYSKLKVFSFDNPHKIYSIWTPFQSIPLQMITVQTTIWYLVRVDKKDTVECKYALYKFNVSEILDEKFPGKRVEQFVSNFSDNHLCKMTSANGAIVIVQIQLDALIVNKFFYKDGKILSQKQSRINIGKADWNYLDVSTNDNRLYIYAGRQKSQGMAQEQKHNIEFSSESKFQVISSIQNGYLFNFKM